MIKLNILKKELITIIFLAFGLLDSTCLANSNLCSEALKGPASDLVVKDLAYESAAINRIIQLAQISKDNDHLDPELSKLIAKTLFPEGERYNNLLSKIYVFGRNSKTRQELEVYKDIMLKIHKVVRLSMNFHDRGSGPSFKYFYDSYWKLFSSEKAPDGSLEKEMIDYTNLLNSQTHFMITDIDGRVSERNTDHWRDFYQREDMPPWLYR
ncbi:MAG TPA: hypothetical protein VIG33_12925 [Pseudobdellovibrionaceae bacterium]|jgi:hypothetical protein